MKSRKPALRVLGALLLIAVMAVLPQVIGFCQDRMTVAEPAFNQIQTVELNFREEIPPLGLLSLMNHGRNWNLLENADTAMTKKEAEAAAMAALDPYRELGLIDSKATVSASMADVSAVSLPVGAAGVIWTVSLEGKINGYQMWNVYLAMDDATGKIINFTYSTEKAIAKYELPSIAKAFSTVFFTELAIEDYYSAINTEMEQIPSGEGTCAMFYRFGDKVYGEVNIGFIAHQNGFYMNYISYEDSVYYTDDAKEVNAW